MGRKLNYFFTWRKPGKWLRKGDNGVTTKAVDQRRIGDKRWTRRCLLWDTLRSGKGPKMRGSAIFQLP